MCLCVLRRRPLTIVRETSLARHTPAVGEEGVFFGPLATILTPVFRVWPKLGRSMEAEMEHFSSDHNIATHFIIFVFFRPFERLAAVVATRVCDRGRAFVLSSEGVRCRMRDRARERSRLLRFWSRACRMYVLVYCFCFVFFVHPGIACTPFVIVQSHHRIQQQIRSIHNFSLWYC